MEKKQQLLTKHDRQRLDKAASLARWSYLGIIIPLVGWIIAANAGSLLRAVPRNEESYSLVHNIKSHILFSVFLSLVVTGIWWSILSSAIDQARLQNQQLLQQQQTVLQQAAARQQCIANVQHNYGPIAAIESMNGNTAGSAAEQAALNACNAQ